MSEDIIEVKKLFKKFSNSSQFAINNVSMNIPRGCFVTIVGTSGSGKTTLLKTINRLYEPTSGSIHFEGRDVTDLKVENYRKKVGYVIQQVGLFPHMTVAENIAVVPKSLKWEKKRIEERVEYLLELVHLESWIYKNRYPAQLSGGQQQRVGLARAMAAEPAVMLMDEPFGAIDLVTRQSLQNELLELQKKLEKTILFVTHDLNEAFKLGERVIIMHDGQIQQYDTPYNILFHPANDYVTRFASSENILEKLRVLTAGAISRPVTPTAGSDAPVVEEGTSMEVVLRLFLETGASAVAVKRKDAQPDEQIRWDDLQNISALRKGEIEYYV
ncbi:MAG: ABC transporter ATP-binding protein [Peptococcaceae bacterium]|jgi:osmoprotectant transport system ATP-binding protein|nr:ABC transporter ATP-binding protein [Peptococcaceae bacterium]